MTIQFADSLQMSQSSFAIILPGGEPANRYVLIGMEVKKAFLFD